MIAALHYGRSLRGSAEPAARAPGAALLRTAAATLVAAMLLGAPSGRARPLRSLVAVDASASWTRGDRALAGWSRATAAARALAAGDSIALFGDSLRRVRTLPAVPADRHSAIAPLLDASRDERRALVIVSDGEFRDGATLPAGTRLTVIAHPPAVDLAVVTLVSPARAAPGDTVTLRVTVRADSVPVADAVVTAGFAGGAVATTRSGPLGSFAE